MSSVAKASKPHLRFRGVRHRQRRSRRPHACDVAGCRWRQSEKRSRPVLCHHRKQLHQSAEVLVVASVAAASAVACLSVPVSVATVRDAVTTCHSPPAPPPASASDAKSEVCVVVGCGGGSQRTCLDLCSVTVGGSCISLERERRRRWRRRWRRRRRSRWPHVCDVAGCGWR